MTERNGRFVLLVRAEHRGNVPGIVHGSSASGASLFLEPAATVEINNDIVELEEREREEIFRILLALTDRFRHRPGDVKAIETVATELDVLQARARKVLQVAAHQGHRTLVLGAWGCGVFRNDPSVVAEAFAQDTWKVGRRLTVDYGLRVLWYTPWWQADGRAAAFSLDAYDPARAPRLYVPVVVNGRSYAQDPSGGPLVDEVLVGSFVPGSGDLASGMVRAGAPGVPPLVTMPVPLGRLTCAPLTTHPVCPGDSALVRPVKVALGLVLAVPGLSSLAPAPVPSQR